MKRLDVVIVGVTVLLALIVAATWIIIGLVALANYVVDKVNWL